MEGLDFDSNLTAQMPKGHEGVDPKDIEKCPFAKSGASKDKKPVNKDNKVKADSDSEDE